MTDRDKVIKAIEICYTSGHNCAECPLFSEDNCNDKLMHNVLATLKEQEAEIRQLRLVLDIVTGTCKGIKSGGGQFADMPTMQSAT